MGFYIYSDKYYLDWPGHVFPVEKFRLVFEKLSNEGVITGQNLVEPSPATEDEVRLVHPAEYLERLREITRHPDQGLLEFEVLVSEAVLKAFYLATGGTIQAARMALEKQTGVMNLSGGFHHAFAAHGEGFCLINDLAVAIRVMQQEKRIQKAMVIDCDLHQGNGTARIFQDDDQIFTFSIHQENNYPIKEKSDLDIGLADFTGDAEYLRELEEHIPGMLEQHAPELIVYQAGADPYEGDQLGTLKLTYEGLRQRDELVIKSAQVRGIPVVITLGGGYAHRIEDVVEIHSQTGRVLNDFYKEAPDATVETGTRPRG